MTTHESWTDYVLRTTRGLPRKDIAAAAQIDVSGVSRWLTGVSRPSPGKVIAFARGLHQPPIEALIAAGYLEAEEVPGAISVVQARSTISDEDLLDEVAQRLAERHSANDRPDLLGPIPSFGDSVQVTRKRASS